MRNFVKLTGGVAIAALLAGPAFAADMIETVPQPAQADATPYVAPVSNWSGAYVGGFAGYKWGRFDGGLDHADGAAGGAFAGYNMQSGNIVYGIEGDLGYSGNTDSGGGVTAKQGMFGSVRGRVGYAMDPVLLYGTAGVAAMRGTASDATSSDSNTHLGYTVGAGADVAITQNVFGRLEYRYSDYQNKDYALTSGTVSSGFDSHSINAGIGIKF